MRPRCGTVRSGKPRDHFIARTCRPLCSAPYRSHYRRMLPRLLETLEFRSNNAMHQPLMRACALLKQYLQSRLQTIPWEADVPWMGSSGTGGADVVLATDPRGGHGCSASPTKCVCCKRSATSSGARLWVVGADRYRNPDDDVRVTLLCNAA